jgi:hypothetical protein
MSDKVNTSGYTCSHYETEMERLARTNKKMKQRIAELEAAQQWRDASDPPTEEGECEVIQYADTPTRRYAFWRNGEWRNQHEQTLGGITHYKRAAPMPEMEACPNNPGCEGNPAVCPSCKDWHRAEADK